MPSPRVPGKDRPVSAAGKRSNDILDAKNSRKRAEADVQLLANRLQHLRNEQAKAQKKIEETKRRASDIKQLKKKNVDMADNRVNNQRDMNSRLGMEMQHINRQRQERQKNVQQSRAYLTKKRRDEVLAQKEHQRRNQAFIKAQREEEERRNRAKREAIIKRQQAVKARKEREAREREARLQAQHAKRMQEEKAKAEAAEKAVRDMEAEEERLIEELRKTQASQRAAYEELQSSLAS
jgi:hypothetical protein